MALVAGLAIGFQNHAIQTAQGNSDKISDIILNINNINNLVYTYMIFREERPKQQFLAEHQDICQMLTEIELGDAEQQQMLTMLKKDVNTLRQLFVRMVFNYDRLKANENNLAALEAGERLGGQLVAASNLIVRDGLALARALDERVASTQRMMDAFVFSLIIGITIVLTFILAGTMKTISVSLTRLAKGAEIIGSGNLHHRIGMTEADEIGDLARSFDRMTTQLSHYYAELRESEERLRHSKERLQLAIEATNLGTFDFSPQTGELVWSDLAKLHFGLPPEAHIDYDVFLSGLHPDDRERVDGLIQGILRPEHGGLYRTEYRTIGIEDGKERWLAARGRAYFNERGDPVRFIGATLDITERKKTENQLQAMKDELEQKVEQRTRELIETQKRYLHAEKLSAIGKLSASIAHEFNNPLQAVMAILRGLRQAGLHEEDRKMLEIAIAECDRVKKLIRDLQNFYRPSSERKEFVDVHKILDSLLLLLKSDFKRKKIAVELDYEKRLPLIFVVSDQIKQVFLNLLSNAAEACLEAGGAIRVGTREEGESIAVTIKDTGVGIRPEEMEQIFEPFYTTKSATKGTGLGLSVSYGIVKNHGGEILVESQPGQGATFTVLLPVKETEKPDVETAG